MGRVLVLAREYSGRRSQQALLRSLEVLGATVERFPDHDWSPVRAEGYDAVVVVRPFRLLAAAAPLDWGGFDGRRLILDHDAYQNFYEVARTRRLGAWPEVIRRHGFEEILTSGVLVAERFREIGIRATWVPKGYDSDSFWDQQIEREGLCQYGQRYDARLALERHLARDDIAVDRISVPYPELNDRLNRYLGCVVCNMSSRVRGGPIGAALRRMMPRTLIEVGPAPEPMIKNFEAAASGCAVFADDVRDLHELGFVDGESVVLYSSFDELTERIRSLDRGELRAIGTRAAQLCRERHTWEHRARLILDIATGARDHSSPVDV